MNNAPLVDELEVVGAARVFKYSTFGSDKTYKFGGRYRPIRDVTFRGTYSTAFRAPNVADLYLGQLPSAKVASDPRAAQNNPTGTVLANCLKAGPLVAKNQDTSTQINSTIGGNPNLKPETAKIGTVGVVFEPTFLKGLSLTADYSTVSVSQGIGSLTKT